jgi:large subunit ribosomal protein L36
MKVRASIKKRSADCKIVRRKGRLFVINKKEPPLQAKTGIKALQAAGCGLKAEWIA